MPYIGRHIKSLRVDDQMYNDNWGFLPVSETVVTRRQAQPSEIDCTAPNHGPHLLASIIDLLSNLQSINIGEVEGHFIHVIGIVGTGFYYKNIRGGRRGHSESWAIFPLAFLLHAGCVATRWTNSAVLTVHLSHRVQPPMLSQRYIEFLSPSLACISSLRFRPAYLEDNSEVNGRFSRLLGALPNLEKLGIPGNEWVTLKILPSARLPRIRMLEVGQFKLVDDELVKFCKRHRESLTHLTIEENDLETVRSPMPIFAELRKECQLWMFMFAGIICWEEQADTYLYFEGARLQRRWSESTWVESLDPSAGRVCSIINAYVTREIDELPRDIINRM